MPETQPHHLLRRWRFIQWPFIWSLAGIAFLLGLSGFKHLPHGTPMSCADIFYSALQLFVLNVSVPSPLNWQFEVARFLAPGVMAYTATQALFVLFREQLSLLKLRFTSGHVVVCRLGRTGYKVATRVWQV